MMNRFEKRKLKTGIYKHVNALMYTCIFTIASIITIAAAVNRTDNVMHIDEEQAVSMVRESVAFSDKNTHKVSAGERDTYEDVLGEDVTDVPENTTESQTEVSTTMEDMSTNALLEGQSVKVTADTLNVRAKASEEADVLGMIDESDVYEVISNQGEWIEINYNGNNGFVKSEYVQMVDSTEE